MPKLLQLNITKEESPSQSWMITFADLLALILTFFVLLYSMSKVQEEQWKKVTYSLAQRLDPKKEITAYTPPSAILSIKRTDLPEAANIKYLHTILTDKLRAAPELADSFHLQLLDTRLIISMVEENAFPVGSPEISESAGNAVVFLGNILQSISNQIEIYGNTSPANIQTDAFPSNWELSLSRSLTVANLLRNQGYQYRIVSYGRSAAAYKGMDSVPEVKRESLARRVDIVIRDHKAGT